LGLLVWALRDRLGFRAVRDVTGAVPAAPETREASKSGNRTLRES
jgi:hypothetical protein